MSVKISELPSLETLADNDILAGVDTSEDTTSKITLEKIKNYATEDVYDKEEVDNTIDALQTQIDSLSTIYNAFPTVSDEGESMTLEDTAEVTFKKLDLKGNTSQETTTGKNLLPNNTTTYTVNGITFETQEDGSILVNGTATALAILNIVTGNSNEGGNFTLPAGEYKLNGCPSGGGTSNYRLDVDNGGSFIDIGNGTTVRYDEQHTFANVRIRIASGYTANNLVFKPMIRLSSVTDATFEKYVGGIPSPNPEYPQDIHVVSGDNTIEICGKNLANCNGMVNTTNNGITFTINKDTNNNVNSITINGTATNYNALCVGTSYRLPAGTYNLYGNGITDNIILQVLNEALTQQLGYVGKNDRQLVLNANTTIILRIMVNANATISNVEYKPMIAKTSGLTYEPYIGNSYPIYLGVENLFDKNNANILNNTYMNSTSNQLASANGTKTLFIPIVGGQTYTVSKILSARFAIATTSITPAIGVSITGITQNNNATSLTITTSASAKYLCVFYLHSSDTISEQTILDSIVIEIGSKANHPSTQPIELCKIGTYQDYFYKDSDKWYLHKEIGKVVLDGSESGLQKSGVTTVDRFFLDLETGTLPSNSSSLCNYFSYGSSTTIGTFYMAYSSGRNASSVFINYSTYGTTTLAQFKTWLSSNNVIVYYTLPTPTNTEITDTTLLEQLETLKLATSYEEQTNISQENNDKPFILDVEAIKKLS